LDVNGIVVIKNVFVPEQVEKVDELFGALPKDWWTEVANVGGQFLLKHTPSLQGPVNEQERLAAVQKARQAMEAGHFSYHFKETRAHHETCHCIFCRLRRSLEVNIGWFRDLTGDPSLTIAEVFGSLYEKGHFLTIHHDKSKGHYAFVFSFNANWEPAWGGLLNFTRAGEVYRVVVPGFNVLTIFRLPDGQQVDHFVSEVVGSRPRFSLSGWLYSAPATPESAK
jgi:Rps23 Pro-64 3,4-dihydroxylase Tpa1-like proline 4-hydroxylase